MLSFPLENVREVLDRGRTDAATYGGFRNPYYGLRPDEGELPGLWFVGDHGVYLMSDGKPPDGASPLLVYAEQCDPTTRDDWFHIKRATFGGDDGVEFLDGIHLEAMMSVSPGATHLCIVFHEDTMRLSLTALP